MYERTVFLSNKYAPAATTADTDLTLDIGR